MLKHDDPTTLSLILKSPCHRRRSARRLVVAEIERVQSPHEGQTMEPATALDNYRPHIPNLDGRVGRR
jgi:hypothetical protein